MCALGSSAFRGQPRIAPQSLRYARVWSVSRCPNIAASHVLPNGFASGLSRKMLRATTLHAICAGRRGVCIQFVRVPGRLRTICAGGRGVRMQFAREGGPFAYSLCGRVGRVRKIWPGGRVVCMRVAREGGAFAHDFRRMAKPLHRPREGFLESQAAALGRVAATTPPFLGSAPTGGAALF